ncbi:MAG: tetratricopeptide repeat protein [Parvibaculales bacterium]
MKKTFPNSLLIFALMLVLATSVQAASVKNQRLSAVILASAQALADDGDYQGADRLLTQSMLADPANDAAFALKGRVQILLDNPKEGRRLLDLALDIRPDNQQAVLWAGQASVSLEDFEDAQSRAERLQQLCGACDVHTSLVADIAAAKKALGSEDGPTAEDEGKEGQ